MNANKILLTPTTLLLFFLAVACSNEGATENNESESSKARKVEGVSTCISFNH